MQRMQVAGRVFGPNREIKVLDEMGKDEHRKRIVWIFCKRCLGIKTVRFEDLQRAESRSKKGKLRKSNQSCGCFQIESFKELIDKKIRKITPLSGLKIWAAAQHEPGRHKLIKRVANELKRSDLDWKTILAVVRKTQSSLSEIEIAVQITDWAFAIRTMKEEVDSETAFDGQWRPPGEFTQSELRRSKGRMLGEFNKRVLFAHKFLKEWGFLQKCGDPEIVHALDRAGFRIKDYVKLANWVLAVVKNTKAGRSERRDQFIRKRLPKKGKLLSKFDVAELFPDEVN